MVDKTESFEQETPILAVIQDIRDGAVDPRTLTKDLRQSCVEVFIAEGYPEVQIAQILHRSEKTIQRDIQEIRTRNSVKPNVEFVQQFIGDVIKKGLSHHDYLVRISNVRETSDSDRIQARISAWRILNGLIERLQGLGYLPLRPKEIIGDLFHHTDDQNGEKSFQEVHRAINDVIDVANQCGTMTPELQENVKALQQRIEKAEIMEEVDKLSKQPKEVKEESHDQQTY
jgi:DNA-binding CsgD family transcriptional regulator